MNELKRDKIKKIEEDNVNHPNHYKQNGIETIDYIESLGKNILEGFCVGNVIKYISRYKRKNGLEDIKKAGWYLEKLIKSLEKNND